MSFRFARLMDQVMTIAKHINAEKVVRIMSELPLSGIEPLLLETRFSIIRAGTLATEAEFLTEALPIRVRAQRGPNLNRVNNLVCGSCGAYNTKRLSGDELIWHVSSIRGMRTELIPTSQ